MAKLYSDENFPQPVVEELRRLGHDVLTIHEDGKSNQQYPDESVLQDATDYGRAVSQSIGNTFGSFIVNQISMAELFHAHTIPTLWGLPLVSMRQFPTTEH